MIRMLLAIRGTIIRLWNFGTRSARLVIRAATLGVVFFVVIPLLVWPFVLLAVSHLDSHLGTGYTAVAAFLPLAAFVVFAIFSVVFLAMVYPLLSGIMVAIPEFRVLLGWFALTLIAAVLGEMAIGLYLAFVPIWSLPWWVIAGLALLVVFLGLWLFLKRQLRWQWGGWVAPTLATAILAITLASLIASFFGEEKEEARRTEEAATVSVQAESRIREFRVNAGQERFTCGVGPGTQHIYRADKPWIALSRDDRRGTYERQEGKYRPEKYSAGEIIWNGAAPASPLLVVGVEDNTTLICEKVGG